MTDSTFENKSSPEFLDFSKLNRIRPVGEQGGNCYACAAETIRILKADQKETPKKIGEEDSAEKIFGKDLENPTVFYPPKSQKKDNNGEKVKEFFNFLQGQEPGNLLYLENGDHAFVVFKSYNNNLFLLDTDGQFYRQLKNPNDLQVQKELIRGLKKSYNFFYDVEEGESKLNVHSMGKANSSWKNNLGTRDESQKNLTWFEDVATLKHLNTAATKPTDFKTPLKPLVTDFFDPSKKYSEKSSLTVTPNPKIKKTL